MDELRQQFACSGCQTLVEADGISLNRQWLEFELTLYNIFSPTTRSRRHNDKKLWSGQRVATEYTWRSSSWRWHSEAISHTGKQFSRIMRTNAKYTFHQPQYTNSLTDTGNKTTHLMFACELASNFAPRMSSLGLLLLLITVGNARLEESD